MTKYITSGVITLIAFGTTLAIALGAPVEQAINAMVGLMLFTLIAATLIRIFIMASIVEGNTDKKNNHQDDNND